MTPRDIEVIAFLVEFWDDDSDHPLPGQMSYQDLLDLCERLGLPHPTKLVKALEKR